MFSAQPEEVYAINTIKAGASGYISKAVNIITINEAILKVNDGGTYLSGFKTSITRVVNQFSRSLNVIKEKEYVYRDIIKESVPTQHVMSNGWVFTHDSSATASDADPTRASDASSSGITDTTALVGIITNYSRCQQNAQQLIALQKWIADNKTEVDRINSEKSKK